MKKHYKVLQNTDRNILQIIQIENYNHGKIKISVKKKIKRLKNQLSNR